jgi:hypothetical protein
MEQVRHRKIRIIDNVYIIKLLKLKFGILSEFEELIGRIGISVLEKGFDGLKLELEDKVQVSSPNSENMNTIHKLLTQYIKNHKAELQSHLAGDKHYFSDHISINVKQGAP